MQSARVAPVDQEVRVFGIQITSSWFKVAVLGVFIFTLILAYGLHNYHP